MLSDKIKTEVYRFLNKVYIGTSEIKPILTASTSITFGEVLAGEFSIQTVTVTGAALGDAVLVTGPPSMYSIGDKMVQGWVSAANTVSVKFSAGSATVNPATQGWTIKVFK